MRRPYPIIAGGATWKAIDLLWELPGRIDDFQSWVRWVNGMDLSFKDVNDWGPFVLCLVGVLWIVTEKLHEKRWFTRQPNKEEQEATGDPNLKPEPMTQQQGSAVPRRHDVTIGKAELPDGTKLHDIRHGDAPIIEARNPTEDINLGELDHEIVASAAEPEVIPIRYGTDDGIEGLSLKNEGEKPALDLTLEPLQCGLWTVSFTGPEVTYLETGHTCFFSVDVEGPPTPLESGSRLFRVLRGWQSETEDWGREVAGRIRYKDLNGVHHETKYRVGIDVLNRNAGLVVRVDSQ